MTSTLRPFRKDLVADGEMQMRSIEDISMEINTKGGIREGDNYS